MSRTRRPRRWDTAMSSAILAISLSAGAHATTYTYGGPGADIPDEGTVIVPIVVPDDFLVVDVTVTIERLHHDACGQLRASLLNSGLGLSITLFDRAGGSTDNSNFGGTYRFNNDFAGDLHATAEELGDDDVIPSGDYHARGDLLEAMGENASGTWELKVEDLESGTTGSFTGWIIEFQGAGPPLTVLHVDDDAGDAGDGADWDSAYHDLRHALLVASVGGGTVEEIRVGQGTYVPTLRTERGEPRSAAFTLVDGLVLRGGYAGMKAQDPDDRDPDLYPTELNGDLLRNDVPDSPFDDPSRQDNAIHVLIGTGTGPSTVLEGFVITAGVTEGGGGEKSPRVGGGVFNDPGSPTIRDCLLTGNWARAGGAGIYNGNGSAPTIMDCRFIANVTDGHGGGVCNQGSSPVITACTFERNFADDGGAGMTNFQGSDPSISNCTFIENDTDGAGGALRNESFSSPTVAFCVFVGNTAEFGAGAMLNQGNCDPVVTDCTFEMNSSSFGDGGAVIGHGGQPTFRDCRFANNFARFDGGAIAIFAARAVIENCTYTDNACDDRGGAVFLDDEETRVDGCEFIGNSAELGGGLFASRGSHAIVNCLFLENTADFGGGLYTFDRSDGLVVNVIFAGNSAAFLGGAVTNEDLSNAEFTNCLFTGNTAALDGAAMMILQNSAPILTNCTFSLNSAERTCGGVFSIQNSEPVLANCVLWGNSDDDGMTDVEEEQIFVDGAGVTVDYCCIEGLTGRYGGTENIGSDPMFVDPDGTDDLPGTIDDAVHLKAGSPSQDTGDLTALPCDVLDLDEDGDRGEPIPVDLDGLDRVVNLIVDRGAYEVQECPADLDQSGRVDFGDLLAVFAAWGPYEPCPPFLPEDIDQDCEVGFGDLLAVLAGWGPCRPEVGACCFSDGTCSRQAEADCILDGGFFQGAFTTCARQLCHPVDRCKDAPVAGNGSYQFSTLNATTDGPTLPEECDEGNGVRCRKDVWIRYVASCAGTATASVCDSDFDTRIVVYEDGDCPGPFLACNDDACGEGGTRSEVSFPVQSGGTYLIRIGSPRFERGEGTLVIDCGGAKE